MISSREDPKRTLRQEPERLDLDQFLPYRLSSLADCISGQLAAIYEERFGINVAQWRVLAWLSHRDVLNARQICEATRMDKARVSRAVQALVERELISRSPSPRDQRLHDLRLTEAGQALLSKLIPDARAWESALLGALTPSEHCELLSAMGKLEQQLERIR